MRNKLTSGIHGVLASIVLALLVGCGSAGQPDADTGSVAESPDASDSNVPAETGMELGAGECETVQHSDLLPIQICAVAPGQTISSRYGPAEHDLVDITIDSVSDVDCSAADDIDYTDALPTAQAVRWVLVELTQRKDAQAEADLSGHVMTWATMFADGPQDAQFFLESSACAAAQGADPSATSPEPGAEATSRLLFGMPASAQNLMYLPAGSFAYTEEDIRDKWGLGTEAFEQTAPLIALSDNGVEDRTVACGEQSATEAVAAGLPEVPLIEGDSPQPWDADNAVLDDYDPCVALSWVTVSRDGGDNEAFDPRQIMFFHYGEFVGVATDRAYPFGVKFTRRSDTEVEIDYLADGDDAQVMGTVDVWWFRHFGKLRILDDDMSVY